jgi:hypothetical protein
MNFGVFHGGTLKHDIFCENAQRSYGLPLDPPTL